MDRFSCASLSLVLLWLCGCGFNPAASIRPSSAAVGRVMGGNQPVASSTIQLYAVGTSGDGSTATPLLSTPVTSDVNGNFTLPAWTCVPGTYVYLTATGGNPGLSTGTNNAALALMTAWGECSTLTSSSFVQINEVTTVAAVSALASFMTSATAVGSSSGDASALQAAFALATEYANPSTGTSPGANVPSGNVAPTAEINTLADVIAACENSDGTGSACTSLFADAKPSGGTTPANTIAALLDVALNPSLNTSALFGLVSATAPFQPTLSVSPVDFGLHLLPSALSGAISLSRDVVIMDYAATQAPTAVTLTNSGTGNLYFGSITITNTLATFRQTNNCPSLLTPGASCTISVMAVTASNAPVLDPSSGLYVRGSQSTLTITDSASTTTTTVPLYQLFASLGGVYEGYHGFPAAEVPPIGGTADFGLLTVGATSSQIYSFGSSQAPSHIWYQVYPIPMAGDVGDFPQLPGYFPCSTTEWTPSAYDCDISFTFSPTKKGMRSVLFLIDDLYGGSETEYYLFTGTGQ